MDEWTLADKIGVFFKDRINEDGFPWCIEVPSRAIVDGARKRMRRICVVITARPSYSRVLSVLSALEARKDVELQIVAAGAALLREYGNIKDRINEDGFPWCIEVPSVVAGDGTREAAMSTGLLTVQLATTFADMRPDVVVTIADRHETLATAIAASYQNIPLCHIQGGEVSGSIDDKVRNAVTQLADIHCVATSAAEYRVMKMLEAKPPAPDQLIVTGCPGIDLALRAKELGPLPGKDFVVLQHSDTTDPLPAEEQIGATIDALRQYADRVLWFWPGEDAGTSSMSKRLRMAGLHPVRNLPPVEFLRTLLGSGVLVGNSSVGIRECSFLGVPVINVGDRQRGRERGPNVLDVTYNPSAIRDGAKEAIGQRPAPSTLYGDGHAGERIASILAGETAEAVA